MKKPGILKVTQIHAKEIYGRDFDAEEWSYQWVKRGEITILRVLHDGDPDATTVFDYVEFSAPVNIEYKYE